MNRVGAIRLVVFTLLLAFGLFPQLATAQVAHHPQVRAVPNGPANPKPQSNPPPKDDLYGLSAYFGATAYPATNSDGTDLWPCFGSYTSSTSANPDCPTIGDPSVPFQLGGVVVGGPQYVWSFADCDGNSATSTPCGQTETWYEDDTNDSTDDLIYEVEATQGSSVIADSGIVDFVGPNPYGGMSPPARIIIYGDQNFGTLGATGKNNGNCDADFNYPITGYPTITYPYVVAANKTCVNPVAGAATITATTEIATPTYKTNTKTGETTVTFKVKYKLQQKWDIWLQ